MLVRWLLPLAFVVLGVLILSGTILKQIPRETGLRTIIGVVVILMGVHRFVASRMPRGEHRRYGGSYRRPWDRQPDE
ncbi:MAG: hypothetical protein IPK53_14435 [bacterium]|nr:hypothetical protein [bacterium]MBK8130046.1 hypothetical protein [bacterium]